MKFSQKNSFLFLCLALAFVSGCVSNRDAASENNTDNANRVSARPDDGFAKAENSAKPSNSEQNTSISDQANTNSLSAENASFDNAAFSHLKPEHAAALKMWLAEHKEWEPAQKSDYNQKFLKYAEADKTRKNYHPYYTTGDFNQDGREDFGIGLTDAKTRQKLAFAVFNAPFDSGKTAFFTDRTEKDDIIIFSGENLFLGPDYSDSGYILEPAGDEYKVKSMFDEMP